MRSGGKGFEDLDVVPSNSVSSGESGEQGRTLFCLGYRRRH